MDMPTKVGINFSLEFFGGEETEKSLGSSVLQRWYSALTGNPSCVIPRGILSEWSTATVIQITEGKQATTALSMLKTTFRCDFVLNV